MNLLAMRKCSRAMSVVFVMCLAFAAHGSANVFDDAVFWFRGGKDCVTANGYMQRGEFFDDLHADKDSHPNHSRVQMLAYNSTYAAFYENASFRTEKVIFPALGTSTTRDMRVLHLYNKAVENKGTNYYWPQCFAPGDIFSNNDISNEYTIVSRMKLDYDGLTRTQCVFRIGHGAGTQPGMWLGFSEIDETTNTMHITGRCTPGRNDEDAPFDFSNIQIPTNTWFDMAVVVGKNNLRVGITAPKAYGNKPTIVFAQTNMWTDGISEPFGGTFYRMFGYSEQQRATAALQNMEKSCFIGSVQQMAIWRRALSDQEVMAAFGMPRPAIFRTGFDNGSSNEFGGERSGSSQTIGGLGSWQGVWDEMQANDTWTINFNALRDEAGLPQIFSIKSLTNSAPAEVEVALNGAALGTRCIQEDARVFWPVKANLVVEGANFLTIRRTDGKATSFHMDSMELGGSLGVGKETGSVTDDQRTSPERTKTGVPSAADPNTYHWPQGLMPSSGITNLHFRVWMDPDVVDKVTSRFWTQTKCENDSGSSIHGDEEFRVYVNGEHKTTRGSSTSWDKVPIEVSLLPGELKGGWNDFEFISNDKTCHWLFGYYRFETVLSRGFSLPPPGMIIRIK